MQSKIHLQFIVSPPRTGFLCDAAPPSSRLLQIHGYSVSEVPPYPRFRIPWIQPTVDPLCVCSVESDSATLWTVDPVAPCYLLLEKKICIKMDPCRLDPCRSRVNCSRGRVGHNLGCSCRSRSFRRASIRSVNVCRGAAICQKLFSVLGLT